MTQARLEQLGIQTVGDLATHEVQELEHISAAMAAGSELARGIDEREVDADQQVQQVSAETTFSEDVRLDALGEAIDRMAGKVWDQALKKGALGRTVVLKLKTDRFRILTRSLTSANPPSSAEELATIARLLCDRVDLPPQTLYRLAGVGMSNFADPQEQSRQPDSSAALSKRRNPTRQSLQWGTRDGCRSSALGHARRLSGP